MFQDFYRLSAGVPEVRVADVDFNVTQIISLYNKAAKEHSACIVFPELCITGYSCSDLFFQDALLSKAKEALLKITQATDKQSTIAIVGLPYKINEKLFNVAAILQQGKILGLVPKTYLPNYREYYELRHFISGITLTEPQTVTLKEHTFSLYPQQIFTTPQNTNGTPFSLGIEICEDLWTVIPPSSYLTLAGANAIVNLSAGSELTGKAAYRRDLILQQSGRCLTAYAYASAGVHESTTDIVFGGHALIAENGHLIAENTRFSRQASLIHADIDFARLTSARLSESSFNQIPLGRQKCLKIEIAPLPHSPNLKFTHIPSHPFVPAPQNKKERCEEIIAIQTAGLAKRMEHTHTQKLVIGISGGLDSTLALLVTVEACKLLGRPTTDILAVTMPGFGTTGRTYNNAVNLCQELHVDTREINITEAALLHFKDIGHNPKELTTTYENVQARERTQILMDLANKLGGMVVGTGDLSEIALGWSTYNGDHMSMYAVNCTIPKTLIRTLIEHIAEKSTSAIRDILIDINNTPVSPELLPPSDDGTIEQKTEDVLGPYDLHDFFLYHFIKYGATPSKILTLAEHAFQGEFDKEFIKKCLQTFIRRFFQQQFKRSCIPDGPKVGTIALSPRGDWRMPSDAVASLWQQELDNII